MIWFDPLKRAAKRQFYGAVENLWAAGFWARRYLPSRPLAGSTVRVHPAREINALIVAPHPDDEVLGAGGMAALHHFHRDRVVAAIVTDGRGSRAANLSPAETAALRRREAQAAADILRIQLQWIGLPEWEWREEEAAPALAPLMAQAQLIYLPSCVDFHPEHLRVARVAASLLQPGQVVRVMELGVPLTTRLINTVIDVRAAAHLKDQALAAYRSQKSALKPFRRMARYRGLRYHWQGVEVFAELSARQYQRLLAAGGWLETGKSPFRGLRIRPFTDPLSYWIGCSSRRRLQHVIENQL